MISNALDQHIFAMHYSDILLYLHIADVNKCKIAQLFSAHNDYSEMSLPVASSPC